MKRYPLVQGLRAVAAASVAFVHIANDAVVAGRDPTDLIAALARSMPWTAGVDIFFVISGFVIVHASARFFGQPNAANRFLRRRLTRIVPLYWALTTLFLAIMLLNPSAIRGQLGGPAFIAASYLFLPWPRPDGLMEPALGLGWTLNYEMAFYAVLATTLRLPQTRAVAVSAAALCLLVAVGGFGNPQLTFWANPIVLEFVLGMGIALAVAQELTLPGWLRAAMAVIAVAMLQQQIPLARPIAYGLPGGLLVAAAVSARRPEATGPIMRGLVTLGDASYAMYLFHPFVMRGFTIAETRMSTHTELGGVLFVIITLCVAQACAFAINIGFERRLTALLRRWAG